MGRTPGGHAPLFAFHSGTSLNSSSLVRVVTGKSPRLFSLARIPPLRNPARALIRAGGPRRGKRGPAASRIPVPAVGERQHGCLAGWLVAVGGCAVFVVA